jgi:poly(3-hydroxybutyrate) depolymerase
MRKRPALAVILLLLTPAAAGGAPLVVPDDVGPQIQVRELHYLAHDGIVRTAYVILPGWYSPSHAPSLPLVVSPHGRGLDALQDVRIWGDLPDLGRFLVVCPEGQGRRLKLYSWGDPGQIADLARMPSMVRRALPWVRMDRRRLYAFGGSMGGQEVLLLLARHPRLLAGAAAFDAPTNLALRYRDFVHLRHGHRLRVLLRREVGGTPPEDPGAYSVRSPVALVRRIAFSDVPLQIWWSRRDRIVADGSHESGLLYRQIERLNSRAPVVEFVGRWRHTAEMRSTARLPSALRIFGLLPRPLSEARVDRAEEPQRALVPGAEQRGEDERAGEG